MRIEEQGAVSVLESHLARELERRRARGVTLVEVLIVVAIMAMLAGGVAIFALPKLKEAQVSTARTSAKVMRRAVQNWQRVNNDYGCPSVSQLVESKELDSTSETDDPWGSPWVLSCTDDEVFVESLGPDKQAGTEDDISVPEQRSASDE